MSFVKGRLKAARDALGKKDYQAAHDAAIQVLDYEPENYNATVFLGFALLELGNIEKSEQVYRKAIAAIPEQTLAWQGILKLYERSEDREKYLDVLQQLMGLYSRSNEVVKCAELLQKYIEIRRESGSRLQVIEALSFLLPDSPLYPTLSSLPPPDLTNPTSTTIMPIQVAIHNLLPTLEDIVTLVEKDETETIAKEIDNRRLRLDEARSAEQLRKAVELEILGASRLPHLYNEILINPNTPDVLRRSTESKLLRHKQRYLYAIPDSTGSASIKAKIASELESLVNGAVILGIPDELAWRLFIEGKDCDTIEGYGLGSLRQFQQLFPNLPLTALVNGCFAYAGILWSNDQQQSEAPESEFKDDPVDIILDAFSSLQDSIFANRVLAYVQLLEVDYPSAIKTAQRGLELVNRAETNRGKRLPQVRKAFNVILSTSLVHLFPPKHHARALRITDDVLNQDPDNISCLMARGYILQAACKWTEASDSFSQVVKLIPEDFEEGLRAREEHAWCQIQSHDYEIGIGGLQDVLAILDDLEGKDLDQARCLWRLGKSHWDMGEGKREEAYRFFILSLKRCPTYAPAFTSLGIHYLEFENPPDPTRASKCFQKAFELDAREQEAARRLAQSFAEEREWDLVEVVARRTIAGEGGSDTGVEIDEDAAAGRYLPTNAWAWKAVGIVELVHKNYHKAIQPLQVALRADTTDQLSWLRLGEAYSKAGRHAAAMKALGRAQELMPDDWMCSFFIGEVQQQLGQYQEAIDSFQSILVSRPSEVGVLMSLGQAHLDLGRAEMSSGFTTRAEQSFGECISTALQAIKASPGFRVVAWKIVADAVFHLSDCPSFTDEEHVREGLSAVSSLVTMELGGRLSGIIPSSDLRNVAPLTPLKALEIAVMAYDYRVSLSSSESLSTGSAWFDLGISLHSWSRKVTSIEQRQKADQQAVSCLKEALLEDPGNDLYWDAFGNINFCGEPKIAQHAYIKALEIDSKNVVTWTNLGLLYFHHGDLELANEAFYKAQTLDPDYAMAWVGQGLVATAHGHDTEATAMFEHAVGLPTDVPEADLELASRIFSRLINSGYNRPAPVDTLFPAFFVLDRYCKRRPDDASALQLSGLICERIGQLELGVEQIKRAISILEAVYEDTEDPLVERQFTIATSNLARLRLSCRDYEGALECFESVLGLLPDDDDGDSTTKILLVQSQFGSGLANFKLGDLDAALAMFEAALDTANDNLHIKGQITVLLAQTLWAMGTEEFRETAKGQLLESITAYPENLAAINVLAGMGIVTEDDSLIDAALSEILALPLERRHEMDPDRDVNYLLIQHHLGQGDAKQALSVAQRAVHAEPSRPEIRRDVASLLIQMGEFGPALAVLTGSSSENAMNAERESICGVAESLAGAPAEVTLGQAQRAIMLAPSQARNWQILAFVRARTVQ